MLIGSHGNHPDNHTTNILSTPRSEDGASFDFSEIRNYHPGRFMHGSHGNRSLMMTNLLGYRNLISLKSNLAAKAWHLSTTVGLYKKESPTKPAGLPHIMQTKISYLTWVSLWTTTNAVSLMTVFMLW